VIRSPSSRSDRSNARKGKRYAIAALRCFCQVSSRRLTKTSIANRCKAIEHGYLFLVTAPSPLRVLPVPPAHPSMRCHCCHWSSSQSFSFESVFSYSIAAFSQTGGESSGDLARADDCHATHHCALFDCLCRGLFWKIEEIRRTLPSCEGRISSVGKLGNDRSRPCPINICTGRPCCNVDAINHQS
jgi:hypothetical protein